MQAGRTDPPTYCSVWAPEHLPSQRHTHSPHHMLSWSAMVREGRDRHVAGLSLASNPLGGSFHTEPSSLSLVSCSHLPCWPLEIAMGFSYCSARRGPQSPPQHHLWQRPARSAGEITQPSGVWCPHHSFEGLPYSLCHWEVLKSVRVFHAPPESAHSYFSLGQYELVLQSVWIDSINSIGSRWINMNRG